jgi:predicted transposase YdaD
LPLAPVSDVKEEKLPEVLIAISERLAKETSPEGAATLWNATQILMGLRHSQEKVVSIIEGISAMLFGIRGIEESSVYQGILKKGEAQGIAEGRIEDARESLLRLGSKKLGPPVAKFEAEIAALADLDRLHDLIDRILDVSTWDELLGPLSPKASAPPSQGVP